MYVCIDTVEKILVIDMWKIVPFGLFFIVGIICHSRLDN
jgi:hypothetical protein